MRSAFIVSVVAGSLTLSWTAGAQERSNHKEGSHFGIGTSLSVTPTTFGASSLFLLGSPLGAAALHLPIDIAGAVRIEPTFGYAHAADDDDNAVSVVALGIGAFGLIELSDNVITTVGGRLGPSFLVDDDGTNSELFVNFTIAPGVGVEYFFSKHFSIAPEATLVFGVLDSDVPGSDLGFVSFNVTPVVVRGFFF